VKDKDIMDKMFNKDEEIGCLRKIKEQYQHKDIFISYPCAAISPLFII